MSQGARMNKTTLGLNENLRNYLVNICVNEHPIAKKLREKTSTMELATMQIASEQGQFMQWLVKLTKARKILEIGTFTGYSALVMALGLPEEGKIITCDINEDWGQIAQSFWQQANVADKIELKLAPALQTLSSLEQLGATNSFDLIFIDADKVNYVAYYELALRLLHKNGLMIIDNILWGGKVVDKNNSDADTMAIRKLNQLIKNDERVNGCALPIADGLFLVQHQ
jgi:predicted O-methyltransferase YrrM